MLTPTPIQSPTTAPYQGSGHSGPSAGGHGRMASFEANYANVQIESFRSRNAAWRVQAHALTQGDREVLRQEIDAMLHGLDVHSDSGHTNGFLVAQIRGELMTAQAQLDRRPAEQDTFFAQAVDGGVADRLLH